MSTFLKSIPRVLVMITPTSQKVVQEKTRGIMRYAHLHGPWEIQFLQESPFVVNVGSPRNWRPDGIITRSSPDELDKLLGPGRKISTVFFDAQETSSKKHYSVHHDVREASEAVADSFMQQGLRHFAYVAPARKPQPFWSLERGRYFAERLREKGFECNFYQPENIKDWGLEQKHMKSWLVSLPKPCGLLAAFDPLAKQVLETSLAAGIRVPDDIAVIGVDDDETICENTVPSLSSVQCNFENGAYMAAELLDNIMRRKIRKPVSLTYGFKQLVPRQSSRFVPQMSRHIASALEFIRLNACEGITVDDVARHLKISRSYLEKQFNRTLNRSVLDEIQSQRLERLCMLLKETTLPIGEIGERCGYETESYLKRLFKKRFGMTMREYRKKY